MQTNIQNKWIKLQVWGIPVAKPYGRKKKKQNPRASTTLARLYHWRWGAALAMVGRKPIEKDSLFTFFSLSLCPWRIPSYILCWFIKCQVQGLYKWPLEKDHFGGGAWGEVEVGQVLPMPLFYPLLEHTPSGYFPEPLVLKATPPAGFLPCAAPTSLQLAWLMRVWKEGSHFKTCCADGLSPESCCATWMFLSAKRAAVPRKLVISSGNPDVPESGNPNWDGNICIWP